MTLLRDSFLYTLWTALVCIYEDSCLHRILARCGAWCNAQIDGSRVLCPLCREGAVARSWPDSFLCRAVNAVINVPVWLLHKLYTLLQPTWEDSFFARLVFQVGDDAPIAQFWVVALLWVIPYSHWNNAYSLMGFALLLMLFYAGSMRTARRLDMAHIGFYPLVLFGAMFLGVLFSYAPSLSLRFSYYHISAAICVLVTVCAVRNGEDLKRLAAGGSVCVAVSGAYGIVQRLQGLEVNESYVDVTLNEGMPGRVFSFFDNPNAFAEVLILLLPLTLALMLSSKRLLSRAVALAAAGIGVVALAMTYSRASWIGFACSLAVLVFLWKPKLIPAAIVAALVCIPLLPTTIWNRILTIGNLSDSSTSSRFTLYEAAIALIKRSPISGGGLGTAAPQAFIRDFTLYHDKAPYVHSHNFYLEVWIQMGLLGVVSFVAAMLWNIKRAARTVRHCKDSAARTITAAAASAMCGAMVCGLADFFWNYPRVLCIFWFVFAMALAGVKVCLQEEAN